MTEGFLKDIFKYMPAQVVPGIVGFVSIPIITRLFLPQEYGNYSLVMATVMVLTTLLGWLTMSIIRFYPAYERDKKLDYFFGSIINLTFITIFALVLIFIIFLLSIKTYLSSNLYLLMFIGVGIFIVTAIFNVLQHILRSKRQVGFYSGFAIWKSVSGLALGLILIVLCKFGIEGLLLGIILGVGIILPLLWKNSVGKASIKNLKVNLTFAKEMAKYSFPLVVGNLAAWVLSLSDRYVIELFRSSQEVGVYSASYNISNHSVMLITTLFMLASGPILMDIGEKKGIAKCKEFSTKVTRYYLMLCIPSVIGLCVLSKPIMDIMTGEQYFEGYNIFPFVTSGILLLGLQKRFNDGLLLYKKTNLIAFSIVSSGLLNLALNFLFIPRYGYFAASITTLISYAFLLFLMIIFSRRLFIWKFPFKSLVKVTCASGIMGIMVYSLGNSLASSVLINLILSICAGVAVYFLALILLREFSPEEIQTFRDFKQKVLK